MRTVNWTIVLLLLSLAGCAVPAPTSGQGCLDNPLVDRSDALAIAQCAERQAECLRTLHNLRDRARRQPDFLSPREQDLVEQAFAEFLACRAKLEQMARRAGAPIPDSNVLPLRCKSEHDIQLAALAVDDQVLGRALNQSFYRSGIPRGTCDRIIHEVTYSPVALTGETQQRVNNIIYRRGWLLPTVENEVRHAPPIQLLWDSSSAISTQLQHGKNVVVTTIVRLKNPSARPLEMSEEQRREIRNSLRPGDVLLTYTAGVASNLIIPGNFKHVAIFVGTEEERSLASLDAARLLAIAASNHQRLSHMMLMETTTPSGKNADVVESVAEGVLLNNFDHILASRVNRLAVLRPGFNDAERAAQIMDALSYVGGGFDFSFDLTDASDQVCTEVAYRCLQGRGAIDIPLSQRAGRLTLTADDLARYSLKAGGDRLPCILIVEEAPAAAGMARILTAAEAQQRLAQLVGAEN